MIDIIGISMMDIWRRIMAKTSPYESGELTDSIFLILLATLKPIHGYRIMQEIVNMTDGTVEIGPATMYTTLKKLKDAGWILDIGEEDGKILYEITEEGRKILKMNFDYRKNIISVAEKWLGGKNNG
jgi:DNA-binding PadR family transcriptional regulator